MRDDVVTVFRESLHGQGGGFLAFQGVRTRDKADQTNG